METISKMTTCYTFISNVDAVVNNNIINNQSAIRLSRYQTISNNKDYYYLC